MLKRFSTDIAKRGVCHDISRVARVFSEHEEAGYSKNLEYRRTRYIQSVYAYLIWDDRITIMVANEARFLWKNILHLNKILC
jgi:hypothetical protein